MPDEAADALLRKIQRIDSAPPLRTVNGVGVRLCGTLLIPGHPGVFISAYWLVFLFIPIVPLAFYVVSGGYPEYRFFGKLTFMDISGAYGRRAWWLVASAWIEGAGLLVVLVAVIALCAGLISLFR